VKIARYKQLYLELKAQIVNGDFSEGSLLPSENELSTRHNMTRVTVRNALQELEKEGLIAKQHGKGSIVQGKAEALGLLSFRGFTDVLSETQHRASSTFIASPHHGAWPQPFFHPLTEAEKAAGCMQLERLRKVDDDPVMLESTFFPNILRPAFTEVEWSDNSLFKTLLNHYLIEVNSVEQQVRAVKAEQHEALLLEMQPGDPLLHILRKYGTNRKGFYLYSSLHCNTEKYTISSVFK